MFLTFIFSLILAAPTNAAELVDKTVAIVNNEVILSSDIKDLAKKLDKQGMIDDLLLQDQTIDQLKKDKNAQLEMLINERLMDSEIKRQNLSVTMERVEQEIKDLSKRNGVTRDQMLSAVFAQNVSESEYQNFLKNRIERQSLVDQEIASKIRISDDDVFAFYLLKTGRKINRVYEYNLSHILFSPVKAGGEDAANRAQNAYLDLKKGKAFDKIAESRSDETYVKGAPLGTFKSGEFSEDFEKAVETLAPGEYSKIVQSKAGFHILRLNSKKEVVDPAFDKEKNRFREMLFEVTLKRQLKAWLEQKKDEALIKINAL